jgi:hypothetical protein
VLALDYTFVVVLLELLMLGIIACSTAISARDHDEENHTTSDNGGLDDVHPGIPIGFTFMVLFLALFYPFREMSAFGQGFFGRRLHVISANSARLVYVHHSGLFNGLGTISFANMFPLQTTLYVGNGSGSLSPGKVNLHLLSVHWISSSFDSLSLLLPFQY